MHACASVNAFPPFAPLPTIRQELDRVFARLWDADARALASNSEWAPVLDVAETNADYLLLVECPGVAPADIRIQVENSVLTLQGERRSDFDETVNYVHRRERACGSFARSVRFPTAIDGTLVVATLRGGVLTIRAPKCAAAKECTTTIQVTPGAWG
jgi:HSP20 family protein